MRQVVRSALVFAFSTVAVALAHADTFTAINTPYGDITATIASSPTPALFTPTYFEVNSVPVVVDGTTLSETVDFYTTAAGGGAGGSGTIVGGPQLFSGTTADPTFLTGTFPLQGFDLTISNPSVSAVPEPSSLLLLGTGALGLAGVLKRKLVG